MQKKLVVSDPAVMMGKPVIAGTRITVELILEKLAAGETVEQILDAHPRLAREAIQAALAVMGEKRWCSFVLVAGNAIRIIPLGQQRTRLRRYAGDKTIPRAEALRQGMLALMARAQGPTAYFAHPFAWAPFFLVGDGGTN